jgi:hypothetical protein
MPLSISLGLEDFVQAVTECAPRAVLDAGIGFGLLGHLMRQYLDVWEGRVARDRWRVRIDGIEIDAKRVLPHARYLYDEVLIGDIRDVVPQRAAQCSYDVVVFGDVLEHLPKGDAMILLTKATALAGKAVLVRIPLGDGWRKEGREEPDHHRSTWTPDDFAPFVATQRNYDYFGHPYGFVIVDAAATRVRLLDDAARRLAALEHRLEALLAPRSVAAGGAAP